MFQIFQNSRPTNKFFNSLSEANAYANLENMSSDLSTFTVKMKADAMSSAAFQ